MIRVLLLPAKQQSFRYNLFLSQVSVLAILEATIFCMGSKKAYFCTSFYSWTVYT